MDIPNIAEKEIVTVQYYNVIFYMIFRKDVDTLKKRAEYSCAGVPLFRRNGVLPHILV